MKNENKKILSIFVIMILIAAAVAATISYGFIFYEDQKIKNESLSVKIFADKTEETVPFEVIFSPIVTDNIGEVTYKWDFGNGEVSNNKESVAKYEQNGSYVCTLTIEDKNGQSASDSLIILAEENQKPTVSIEIDTDQPQRPYNFWIEQFLDLFLNIDNWCGNHYRWMVEKGLLDPFFKDMPESFYTVEAFANDPDGDTIVSYNWTMTSLEYKIPGTFPPQQKIPEFHYSGKIVEIPIKDMYTSQDYSLKLTVTDSEGQQRSENLKFNVRKSDKKTSAQSMMFTFSNTQQKWTGTWKNGMLGAVVLGGAAVVLKTLKDKDKWPAEFSFPFVKLLGMMVVGTIFQTSSDEYTDESMVDVFERMVYKPRLLQKIFPDLLTPDQWKNWFDKAEEKLITLSEDDRFSNASIYDLLVNWSLDLQLIEEEIGLDNNRPIISDPFPEENANNIPVDCRYVSINVDDAEGDLFNVTIYGESIDDITYNNSINGTFNATLITPLEDNKEIFWYVKVVDQNGKVVETEHSFNTFIQL